MELVNPLMQNLKNILRYNKLFIIAFILVFVYIVIVTIIIKYESKYSLNDKELVGTISTISVDGNKLSLVIKAQETVKASYYIKTESEKAEILDNISLGDKIKAYGTFKELATNKVFNGFNYKKYLYNKKIYYSFQIDKYEIVKPNKNIFYKIKNFVLKRVYQMDNSDYLLAFILGDKSLLTSDIINDYQQNGLSHLLAISGMHLNTFLLIVCFLLRNKGKFFKNIVISLLLFFFLFLTNFSASIFRAVLFYLINMVNKEFNLYYSNIQVLLITAFILIFINPFFVYDVAFIYSFIVTFGILYNKKYIQGSYLKKLFILTFITFIYSLPITAYLNYEVNLLAILINLIFVPLVSLVLYPLILFTFFFPWFSCVLSILIYVVNSLNHVLGSISIVINIPKMSIILIILYYVCLFFASVRKKVIIILVILSLNKVIPCLDSAYYVYYFDVGQGDCSVIIYPYKSKVIMVDTGGLVSFSKEAWQQTSKEYHISTNVLKYLKSLGVTEIDYLILSHGDYDHMGEAINLVNNFKVENIIFNCGSYNELEKELIKVLEKKKIKYSTCLDSLKIRKSKIYFLNTKIYDNENDNSLVLYMNIFKFKFLFMGDAGIEKEKDILEKYNLKNIDVLKVGHHGSKTSSSKIFIDETNPKYGVISVGKNNRYGHPNKKVLNNLDNSKIYRTDQDGSIMFKIKNNRLKIKTSSP